jgi:hypothetical protein
MSLFPSLDLTMITTADFYYPIRVYCNVTNLIYNNIIAVEFFYIYLEGGYDPTLDDYK